MCLHNLSEISKRSKFKLQKDWKINSFFFIFRYLGYAAKILTCYTSGTWNSLMTTGLNFCPETDTETGLYVSASSVRLMPVATNVRSQPHLSSVRLLHWMLWVSTDTISNSVFSILKYYLHNCQILCTLTYSMEKVG